MRTIPFALTAGLLFGAVLSGPLSSVALAALPSSPVAGLGDPLDYFPGSTYDPAVPTPAAVLGFPLGRRATTAAEVERCLKAWTAAAPDRTRLVEYARSHEGRPLYQVVITAPQHMSRLDDLQAELARHADPRQLTDAEAERLRGALPAPAWLAYNIHGDETEGSDAALVVLFQLIASTDAETARLRDDLVILVDPLMNPDGRDRFVKMVAENRGAHPNVDDQSLVHDGYWPYGRGNHYLFDLNRDWLWAIHPETRGRLREVARWNPVLFVDAHGMGSQDTHLFSPPREPVNPNIPAGRATWGAIFARDQATAFDRHGLVYYSGEWHEEWYPGYSDAYASYRGAMGILYEQARVAEDGVRRPEGRILTYAQSVQHHVVGSLANLRTAQAHGRELLAYQRDARKRALDPAGPYGRRTFAVLPSANASRFRDFAELARLHGFEVFQAPAAFTVPTATNQLGQVVTATNLPAGTLLIPNRQPLGHLVAAALEFDPRMSEQALREERQELLRDGTSRIYDTTAWNLTMFFGLEALTLPTDLPEGAAPFTPAGATGGVAAGGTAPVAFVIDGADDLSVAVAGRLLERAVQVRAALKDFQFDGRTFVRGSVVVTALDNRTFRGDLGATVDQATRELGLTAVPVASGYGPGELADLGGGHFLRLEAPRIGLFSRGRFDFTDYGSIWHTLDHRLGMRHSHLEDGAGVDLARYNLLIVPNAWGGSSAVSLEALKEWVRDGGTLVAIGGSANRFTSESAGFSRVRPLPEVLGKLSDYELTIFREWLGRGTNALPPGAVWNYQPDTKVNYPWQAVEGAHPDEKELKRRDAWQAVFMPQGALLASRVDTNHWLTFGCSEPLSLLADRRSVLMAADGVEAPIRYGFLAARAGSATPATPEGAAEAKPDPAKKSEDKKDKPEPARIGWAALPPGTEMYLRQSGLLWPEAGHRIASTAYVTREGFGRGQIILFATPPTFRAAQRASLRVFMNAVVFGPGLGATHSLRP